MFVYSSYSGLSTLRPKGCIKVSMYYRLNDHPLKIRNVVSNYEWDKIASGT